MSDVRQVKVDNWGIYFLQRLKHFFNRTDYCDLTLQFQDNAQLKVHRLVLSACTEYFELLERTCEMYEDCLVMPDDLQADVVVPIVNFMYTGHLEFRLDLLERLYQTSQILNMPVLSKLLEAHRQPVKFPSQSYSAVKRLPKVGETSKISKPITNTKRSYSKAFVSNNIINKDNRKVYQPLKMCDNSSSSITHRSSSPVALECIIPNKKLKVGDSRPSRYELPEELDTDNVFDNSFSNISYACKPLMIHPETVKRYSSKRSGIFSEASSSKKILPGMSTVDIVECKKISKDDNIFDDGIPDNSLNEDLAIFQSYHEPAKTSSQLFDKILDDGPKVTIETRDSKVASNLDHAKIISEVLKKYPHLVKSNKNIKLKILNTPKKGKKPQKMSPVYGEEKPLKLKTEQPDYTYETDVIDSQQAAKLIAMGAENTKGPWICLICGTPGKALHFTSYYKFRRHLVEVHNEKPVSNICEYCGLRSLKRNYLLHHLYSQHNVPPPPQYHFPKCDRCNYIALTEGFLIKHKLTHQKAKNFRCNVCSLTFTTTKELLQHIQATGHKYSAERKTNLQCIYCLKVFLRHVNLYAHLKINHKKEAKNDGIIDDSDEEKNNEEVARMKVDNRDSKYHHIKFEPSTSYDIYNENIYEDVDVQYQIQESHDGDIQLTPRKQVHVVSNQQHNSTPNTPKQKILNPGFDNPNTAQKPKTVRKTQVERTSFLEEINIQSPPVTNHENEEEIVLIDNTEYILRDNQLIPKRSKSGGNEYIISDMIEPAAMQAIEPTTSMEYSSVHNTNIVQDTQPSMVMKKASNINQPIQFVVSNEEEYQTLMSSNHPILFNNGDPNKTLTVLTGPHNAGMESAAIDLNNTQSSDMMIIQENFPLNVTEAVPTDNPNIVVVYSHPVDDQNKHFQILTTGGIGSQFVQSSAIITQNYETVTTTAPVMSAHVLEPQPDSTWQDNIQDGNGKELPICTQSELQNVVQNVEIKPQQNENTDSLSELPEVHLGPGIETIVSQENLPNNTTNDLSMMNMEHVNEVGQEMAEVSHNIPAPQMESVIMGGDNGVIIERQNATAIIEPMDISHSNEHNHTTATIEPMDISHVNEQTTSTIEPMNIPHGNEHIPVIVGNDDTVNTDTIVQGPIGNDIIPEQTDIEKASEIITLPPQVEQAVIRMPENSVTVDTVAVTEVPEIVANDLKNTLESEEPPQSQAYDDIVVLNHNIEEEPHSSSKPDEKIQNLTSEWSEDEYDVPEDAPATSEPIPRSEEIIVRPAEPEVLEETIENIQQEVLNHVSTAATLGATIEPVSETVNENPVLEDASSHEEPQMLAEVVAIVPPIPSDPQAQQKISSLLNDWEDNDSQEENNSEDTLIINKETNDTSTSTIPKPDIKSLVSDWDDEEEENKE